MSNKNHSAYSSVCTVGREIATHTQLALFLFMFTTNQILS